MVDGACLYAYVRGNPVLFIDRNGCDAYQSEYLKGSGEALTKAVTGGATVSDIAKAYQENGGGFLGSLAAIDRANPFARMREAAADAYAENGKGLVGTLAAIDRVNPFAALRDEGSKAYRQNGGGLDGSLAAVDAINPIARIRDDLSAASSAIDAGDARGAGAAFTGALIKTAAIASIFTKGVTPKAETPHVHPKVESGSINAQPRAESIAVDGTGQPAISEPHPSSPIPESYMKPEVSVDMRQAPAGSGTNAAGFQRNGPWFWRALAKTNPELFDPSNLARIRGGRSPIVNQKWIENFQEHQSFSGEKLVHHHINQGPNATPLPEPIHQVWHSTLHPNR